MQPFAGVVETHAGVVFFVGDRAYKLKKPVSLGFLDFTSPETRKRICEREVELNSRLSPDVYLGVADVTGPDGAVCDHLVVMRRLPDDTRLSRLVAAGEPVEEQLRRLAELLSRFHRGAERSAAIDATTTRDAVLARWEMNQARMAALGGSIFDPRETERVLHLARRFLAGREELFRSRLIAHRACDGHGDLLASDIFCLEDGPRVLDCLEFDDQLRYGDVLGDVAFLAMDLEHLGRPDLSAAFLDQYRTFSSDGWPASLAHHYIAYRAQVRALVAGVRAEQGDKDSAFSARALLRLATDHLDLGQVRLVVVGGLPGSGKSTLAGGIASVLGAVTLRSDEVRKQIAGLDVTSAAPADLDHGIYRPDMSAVAYNELIRQASVHLSMGQSVVLDATFENPSFRQAGRDLARDLVAELSEFRCVAPQAVLETRIQERAARADNVSDATVTLVREMQRRQIPWPTAKDIHTAEPTESAVRQALEHLTEGRPN